MWGIVARLVGWLLGLLRKSGPSPEAAQAERAGVAETKLSQERDANAEVAKAVEAARASDRRSAADPGGLRDPSPDSRD